MAQTNFFGLTSYGAGTTYEKTIARPLLFHHVSDAVFVDLFRKHALGDSHLAIVLQVGLTFNVACAFCPSTMQSGIHLQVDGSTTMLTKDVLGLFQEALGRKPTVAEVNAVQT